MASCTPAAGFPQTLQELLKTEDSVALQLQTTTGELLRLVSEFEKKHAALVHQQSLLTEKSGALRGKISSVESAVKRLTFPSHMAKLSEIIKEFVDENSDLLHQNNNNNDSSSSSGGGCPVAPSELVRFTDGSGNNNSSAVGLPPMTREEQMQFSTLFGDGGVLESRGGAGVNRAYFSVAGRVPPQPLLVTKAENPDEVLLDMAYVPFVGATTTTTTAAATTSSCSENNNNNNNNIGTVPTTTAATTSVIRRRSPLTDIAVMRCPAVGGRVLVSRRAYQPGALILVERPFLSVPRSTTALLPLLPPLLQRVVKEMLVLPQAQAAMKHQGWDPQLVNCVLVYLAQQTFDAMARSGMSASDQQQQQQQQQQKDKDPSSASSSSSSAWMWKAPAPLFHYLSGDFLGEDPATTRRMRKLLFLGAPLQAMDAADVHRLHRLAQFIFSALPPCYRDFEGDEGAARKAALEWARRGVAAGIDTLELQQQEAAQHKPGSAEAAKAAAQQLQMAPYDDNPAHRQVAVSPLGREACVAAEATAGGSTSGGGSSSSSMTDAIDSAAVQLPGECRVSVSDIARLFAVFQTNCISLRDERAFASTTVDGIEAAAARALAASDNSRTAASAALSRPPPSAGLFTFLSLLEHSCCPNVVWCPSSSSSSELELRALRKIVPGERLRVSYIPPILPTPQRRARLKRSFLFDCTCEACVGVDWSRPICVAAKKKDNITNCKQPEQQQSSSGIVVAGAVPHAVLISVPISTTGDWVDVSGVAAASSKTCSSSSVSSSVLSSSTSISARGSGAAASRVRCETEAYRVGGRRKAAAAIYNGDGDEEDHDDNIDVDLLQQQRGENGDDDEEEEDDDDEETAAAGAAVRAELASRKMSKRPFKLVNDELRALEGIFFAASTSSSAMTVVHPLHIATYLHVMRLSTAWSYLLLACCAPGEKEQQSKLYAERVAPLAERVCAVTREALRAFVGASIFDDDGSAPSSFSSSSSSSSSSGSHAAAVSVVKKKLLDAIEKIFVVSTNSSNESNVSISNFNSILPAELKSVLLYSATLPLLENVAVNLTLEGVMLLSFASAGKKAPSSATQAAPQLPAVSELWLRMAELVETVLGWEKSPLATKYRLYCANPKQSLSAPMEQPF